MIEFLVGMGVGGGILLMGEVAGVLWMRSRKPKPPKPIEPICGCEHHYSMHEPQTGECKAGIQVTVSQGEPILSPGGSYIIGYRGAKYEWRNCACHRYTGPEPLPSYYAPEIAS